MTILAPTAPTPKVKLKVHATQAVDMMVEMLDFLHAQESPWHPAEIHYLFLSTIHHFVEKHGIGKPPVKSEDSHPVKRKRGATALIKRKKP